jgi:hypothetical protein
MSRPDIIAANRRRGSSMLKELGNLPHRESHNYVVAHGLLDRALAAAGRVVALGDDGRSLIERIRTNQQAVSETLPVGDRGVGQGPTAEMLRDNVTVERVFEKFGVRLPALADSSSILAVLEL